MCDKLRTPRRPPSIFGARRGEIQDDLDPVSISAPTSWCASVVPCSVTAAMLTSRFGPICSIALGSKEMDRRCQLPFRASGSSSSLMAVRYTEPIRTLGRSVASQVPGLDARRRVVLIVDPIICFSCPRDHLLFAVQPKGVKRDLTGWGIQRNAVLEKGASYRHEVHRVDRVIRGVVAQIKGL